MEEGVHFIQYLSDSSQLPSDPPTPTPTSQTPTPSDYHQHLISQLLSQGKSIFTVEYQSIDRPICGPQFFRQEQLKQKILSYNRKEKSLQELSRKFIDNFEGRDGLVLELDKVTVQLKVERRRIYDIVNIFESLQVVKKAAKNNYVWRGLKEAVITIRTVTQMHPDTSTLAMKRQKSLENLAARFLQLFILSCRPISLQQAAKILIHSQDSALVKTKIRRLYDIVNVFKSIGLVRKVPLPTKKTGFQWQGVNHLQEIIADKKQKCSAAILQRIAGEDDRENISDLVNRDEVVEWFCYEQKKQMFELSFTSNFSQKVFEPSILKKSITATTLPPTSSDLYPQY